MFLVNFDEMSGNAFAIIMQLEMKIKYFFFPFRIVFTRTRRNIFRGNAGSEGGKKQYVRN
jgi:hypothetical protein